MVIKVWVGTEGPPDAKIMFIGEAPGKDENTTGKPFCGYAGRTFNQLLSQAGIARHLCLVTNVARVQPPGNRISAYYEDKNCTIPTRQMKEWIDLLQKEIILYDPNVLVALGNTALYTLTGFKKISDYRGYIIPSTLVPGKKVLATYHPQNINYEWRNFFPTVLDLRKASRHSTDPHIPQDNSVLVANASPRQFIDYLKGLNSDPNIMRVTLDVETSQPGTHISIIGIAHSREFAMSVKLLNGKTPTMPERDEIELYTELAILGRNKEFAMQNAPFDKGVLWYNQHILIEKVWMDTLIAAHCCWPELPRDLGFLASICLDVPPWKMDAKEDKSLYNAGDCTNTHGIAEVLDKQLDVAGVRDTFNFEMRQINPSLYMQLHGIYVNPDKQKDLIKKYSERAEELETQLRMVIGKDVNFDSPKQLQQLLYMDLGLPVQYKRRKSVNDPRTVTADADALKKLSILVPDNPVFKLILEYKKCTKLVSGFLEIELSPESRVHTSYNITGKKMDNKDTDDEGRKSFGRWSSSASIIIPYGSGNLQNIPEVVRPMYTAPSGFKIVQADYSQAEAVVVAYLTGDRILQNLFETSFGKTKEEKKKYDVHKFTANLMFGIPYDQITDLQRKVGKTLRHATNYSAGPVVLATRLGISVKEARTLIEVYHKKNPLLRIWYQRIQDELRNTKTLTNLFGRKHRFLSIWGDQLFRSAYSYIPQSTVGDLLNRALVDFYEKYGEEYDLYLQLHDALYVICQEDKVDEVISLLKECMLIKIPYRDGCIQIDVDFKVSNAWHEED
jgi:uracil-DNA glycosylase family 4